MDVDERYEREQSQHEHSGVWDDVTVKLVVRVPCRSTEEIVFAEEDANDILEAILESYPQVQEYEILEVESAN